VAWVGDITYIPTDAGRLYLASVLDLGSRRLLMGRPRERATPNAVGRYLIPQSTIVVSVVGTAGRRRGRSRTLARWSVKSCGEVMN
jgi:hypothetical protein